MLHGSLELMVWEFYFKIRGSPDIVLSSVSLP